MHKRYHGTHFRNLIGDSHNPDERTGDYTSREIVQLPRWMRKDVRTVNGIKVDECGVNLGYNNKFLVWSTK